MLDTNTQWTLASGLSMLAHLALTVNALLDFVATFSGEVKRWRRLNAAWCLVGQAGLFLIALDHAAVGVIAITMLPPPTPAASAPAELATSILIAGEWGGALVAFAFLMARRAITSWVEGREIG